MAETFNCPSCGGPLEYTRDSGSSIRCPHCFNTVIVPEVLRGNRQAGGPTSSQGQSQLTSPPAPHVDPQQLETEIRQLLASRQKITAIKVYRQATAVGLKEAKDAVEAIEAGGRLDASQLMQPASQAAAPVDDDATFSQATQLIRDGKKIEAIKLLRLQYDLSLKVAKEAADRLDQGQIVDIQWLKIQANRAATPYVKQAPDKSDLKVTPLIPGGCVLLVILVVIIILLAVFLPTLIR
jgi:LSD1 subclass zinc finger protein